MSPEQAVGDTAGARVDVYALGCVVYEMLAGEPPYAGGSTQALLAKHVQAPIPDVRLMRPTLGAPVQRVVERALAKVPADRYASAGELVRELERALAASPKPRWAVSRRVAAVALIALIPATGWLASGTIRERWQRSAAARAFDAGERARMEWDLVRADSMFERAVGRHPSLARASLWLAQVRAWRGLPVERWTALADRAQNDSRSLTAPERQLARALVLLAERRYAEACGVYDTMRGQGGKAEEFAAWFGLGQCRTMDRTVVSDSSSPSGWRFRSNHREAVLAYRRAFAVLPSVYRGYEHDGFARLRALLLLSTDLVVGHGAGATFYARLGMPGDTLALIPYPAREVQAGLPHTVPPGFEAALMNQRLEFRQIANGWSTALPRSAGAKEAVAIALDMLDDPRALDTLAVARRLATDDTRRLRLVAAEALMRARLGVSGDSAQLRRAARIIDSLLEHRSASVSDAAVLAPLAALGGRCGVAEQLSREMPALGELAGSPHPEAAAQAFLARAALGCGHGRQGESLDRLADVIARAQAGMSLDEQRAHTERLLLRPVLLDAIPDSALIDRLARSTTSHLLLAAQAIVRRDTSAASRAFTAYDAALQEAVSPPTPDMALAEARLRTRIGDTTGAVLRLDRMLLGARRYDRAVLVDPARAGAFVRAMAERAELAAARGDSATARKWATPVTVLWSSAEEELGPTVARMRRYAAVR
jgi:hypothetical protein